MAIQSGTHWGSYEILSAIGAGGMGEVYRARDTKLGRDVALKALPEAFARDAERIARFQREAKVLASLTTRVSFSTNSTTLLLLDMGNPCAPHLCVVR
jgi:serine/threonine protein kinase